MPYARNARTHSEQQVKVIADSIQRFGWTNPMLIGNDNDIIAGHGRVLAAKHLGLKVVPALRIGHLSDEERRAYLIADNQTGLRAGWDLDTLRLELTELKGMDFDLGPLGFDDAELAAILDVRPTGATDPDDVPDVPANPVATRGDLWALGRHRLLCGDATNIGDVESLLDGEQPAAVVTDPPFGMSVVKRGIALLEWCLAKTDGLVLDLFLGSGSTLIAAEADSRRCLGLEMDPAYIDVAIQRWQNFTGERATLDGKTFDQVKSERVEKD